MANITNKKLVYIHNGVEYWHVTKASEYLGLTNQTLNWRAKNNFICSYKFPSFCHGNPNYYKRSEIEVAPRRYKLKAS